MDGDPLPYRSIFSDLNVYDPDSVLTNWKAGDDQFYRTGFLLAAEFIATHMMEQQRGRELTVYPMLFCLRHFIELCCKRILTIGSRLGLCAEPKMDHDILELWSIARQVIAVAPFVDYKPSRDRIERLVMELGNLDARSTALRYPLHRGKPSLGNNVYKVDLGAVLEHIHGACSDLSDYADLMEAALRRSEA